MGNRSKKERGGLLLTIREMRGAGVTFLTILGVQQTVCVCYMRPSCELKDGVILVRVIGLEFGKTVSAV